MRWLYLASVWLHILAATVWIGGMGFLVLVVVPWMRSGNRAAGAKILAETGARFRAVGWACFAIVLATGTFNLWGRGVRLGDFARPEWRQGAFGSAVLWKLAVFAAVLALSAAHDFYVGPAATAAIQADPDGPSSERLRRRASWMGRVNALLALALVALAVVIVRGWPW